MSRFEFLHMDGLPVTIQGYALVVNQHSARLPELNGFRELILPEALDDLRLGAVEARLQDDPAAPLAHSAGLRLWKDEYGLAFEMSSILANPQGCAVAWRVAQGHTAGAGFHAATARRQEAGVSVVQRISDLRHLGPCVAPAYPGTGCWLNFGAAHRLDRHRGALRERWEASEAANRADCERAEFAAALTKAFEKGLAENPSEVGAGAPRP